MAEGPGLFGREQEVGLLRAAARQATAGRGGAVLVEGEAGIGKTALLQAVADDCAALGMRVQRAGAEELERDLPFSAAAACLDVLAAGGEGRQAHVAGLLRGTAAVGQPGAAGHDFVIIEAMLDLVDEWRAAGPTAIIVDDVQWADPQSIVVLHRLCRGIETYPLLVVLAGRPQPRGEAMAGLARSMLAKGAQRLELTALPDDAVRSLVEAHVRTAAGPRLMSLVHAAEGNPLYVTELVAALADAGRIQLHDTVAELDAADADDLASAASLREAVLRRLDVLPADTRDTMLTAAVLGTSIDVDLLAAVLDMPVLRLSAALTAGTRAGLLVETDQQPRFRHDLIRQVLAGEVTAAAAAVLHSRAAQVLIGRGADAEQVAEHLTDADPSQYTGWLLISAQELTVRAPKTAIPLLHRALAATGPATGRALTLALVRALLWDGDYEQAERLAHAALADAGQSDEAELRQLLVDAYFRQGRIDQAATNAEQAAARPQLDPAERGRLHGLAATCRYYLGQFDAAEHAATQALHTGQATGDTIAQVRAYITLSAVRFSQNRLGDAMRFNTEAMAVVDRAGSGELLDPLVQRGLYLAVQDRLAEADTALATAAQRNREHAGFDLTLTYLIRANLWFVQGRWDDALAEIGTGLDSPDPLQQASALRGLQAVIGLHRGQPAPADAGMIPPQDALHGRFPTSILWAWALAEETRSGPARALELLLPVWERPTAFNPRIIGYRLCADMARLAYAAGDTTRLRALADDTAALLTGQPSASLEGTTRFCYALAHPDPQPMLAAADCFHRAGWPLHEGYAREHATTLLARDGELQPAREQLTQALAIYTDLDAVTDIARARASAHRAGIRSGVRGPRKRPTHGWDALTETELKVAALVAQGRSNPDIATQMYLSPRTVQSHVSRILAKLDLRSRVEVAVATAARAL
jgi:DNA-binding CsgD family transcriptional regulator